VKPRILLVEDDDDLVRALSVNLAHEGYEVDRAADGDAGLARARESSHELVLLDLTLPGRDGFEILETIRAEGVATPVICLTARGQESDVVAGLSLGADDYVVKPFSVAELMARIDAVLRRTLPADGGEVAEVAGVRIDFGARRATLAGGGTADLTPAETDLLSYLVGRRGRAVPREEILKDLWGLDRFATTRTLDNHVARIRKKIEPNPDHPVVIVTVHGVGYRIPG
jgi:DNA-binding response OmpR family regulator